MSNQFYISDNNEIPINLRENTLLEASAGTGKTYSLERIILNLIKDRKYNLNIKEILVVTFTNKATREMKERIRKILIDSYKIEFDPQVKQALEFAISDFDEAAIFTIHGFCQNALNSYPFESKALFNQEINKDDNILISAVWDFLRNFEINGTKRELREFYAFRKNRSFTEVVKELVTLSKLEDLRGSCIFLPCLKESQEINAIVEDFESRKGDLYTTIENLKGIDPGFMLEISKEMKCLTRIQTFEKISNALQGIECFEDISNLEDIYKLGSQFLESKSKKEVRVSEISINYSKVIYDVDIILSDLEQVGDYNKFLTGEFIKKAIPAIDSYFKKGQEKSGVISFSDLIDSLHKRITDEKNPSLLNSLRSRYKIALIDEFQDTDKKQWEIFNTIFGISSNHNFFLIGDPKQSIYGFRSADLEIYYKACNSVDPNNRYVLGKNFRSEDGIVKGVNTLFSAIFGVKGVGKTQDIKFLPAESRGLTPRDIDGVKQNIEFLLYDEDIEEGEIIKAKKCKKGYFKTVVKKIEELVNIHNQLPGDICILVENHKDSINLRARIQKKSIPVVISRQKNVYKSQESEDIKLLLRALCHPGGYGEIKSLLLTPLFGLSLNEIHQIEESGELEVISGILYKWSKILIHYGIISIWKELESYSIKGNLQARLLSQINGERSYTNYKHLIENLNEIQRSERLDSYGLYQWLVKTIDITTDDEENSVRLDRDSDAVQIMTIHASKGLEFPIVFFVAGLNSSGNSRGYGVKYAENDGEWIYDFQKRDYGVKLSLSDAWEEKKRLYYVALTRAVSKLYLPLFPNGEITPLSSMYASLNWKDIKTNIENKADGFIEICEQPIHNLLKITNTAKNKIIKKELANRIYSDIEDLANRESDVFYINNLCYLEGNSSIPLKNEDIKSYEYNPLKYSYFRNRVTWVSSYSGLTKDSHGSVSKEDADREDDEDIEVVEYIKSQEVNTFNIPGGANFGDFIHEFFEEIEFSKYKLSLEEFKEDERVNELINIGARRYFDLEWLYKYGDKSKELIWNTLNSKLPLGDNYITLGEINEDCRIHEREFYFKVDKPCEFNTYGLNLKFEEGYIKGFIDLIFTVDGVLYIGDWKTTTIKGDENFENYSTTRVEISMNEHNYHLQGLIYSAALYMHLKKSKQDNFDYNRDFGGYLYFYVRGMSPETSTGISFKKPKEEEIISFLKNFREDV
ncbi:MAG: UvrD-helicase domain-containing protein [Spirochaetales bacterium]|nr:UvrD-helicase domain-containing protein [Spirochaetales bacterium]